MTKKQRWALFFVIMIVLILVAFVIQIHVAGGTPIFDYYFPLVEKNLTKYGPLPTPAPTMPIETPIPYPSPAPTPGAP